MEGSRDFWLRMIEVGKGAHGFQVAFEGVEVRAG